MSNRAPPEWENLKLLPPHCRFITGRKGEFLYRQLNSQWQVIVLEGQGLCTFYNGLGTDHPDITLEHALTVADNAWARTR